MAGGTHQDHKFSVLLHYYCLSSISIVCDAHEIETHIQRKVQYRTGQQRTREKHSGIWFGSQTPKYRVFPLKREFPQWIENPSNGMRISVNGMIVTTNRMMSGCQASICGDNHSSWLFAAKVVCHIGACNPSPHGFLWW